jgi:transposase
VVAGRAADPACSVAPAGWWAPPGGRPAGPGRDLYLTQAGCSWWKLPEEMFGVTRATAHRRFAEWTRAGLWERPHQAVLDQLGAAGRIDWSRAVVDSIAVRAEKRGI